MSQEEEDIMQVSFNKEQLKRFKREFNKAKPNSTFIFEGNEYLKEYAKYVIEYLESRFKKGLK